MTETKTLTGYASIKSLLEENDKRVCEYAMDSKDETLNRLYETFSLISAIIETAAASKEIQEDRVLEKKQILKEASVFIDLEIAFEDRLAALEEKYMQARNIRIRCVTE